MKGPNPMIRCACGCRGKLRKRDERGRARRYLPGHAKRAQGSPSQAAVLTAVRGGARALPAIVEETGLTSAAVSCALTALKGLGKVINQPRGSWRPAPRARSRIRTR